MNLRHLKHSPALLCALAAPLLYAGVTLIALRSAARTGLDSPHENPLLPSRLDGEIASARGVTLGIALILAAEAAVLAALGGRLNRRSTAGGLMLCTAAGVVYLLTLVLAVLGTYVIVLYPSGDVDLGLLFPDWYFPALIVIAIVALAALTVWLSAAVRRTSVS
ncbi:hypothetical protein [Streptosporangium pseudovulgare]|uniref:Uncharacterized protein n=1 Tax=Streptosporangium pseudovulgare TaxID=35765 RepID=A0ABQ2RHJ7_9ACTN|nr:hypothetical protein [Streptosporangium pseudovulgare]GGQ32534.1 hypothetical protein GCM10010140_73250 [Streptosporangium pseudovulgare]